MVVLLMGDQYDSLLDISSLFVLECLWCPECVSLLSLQAYHMPCGVLEAN